MNEKLQEKRGIEKWWRTALLEILTPVADQKNL
jgi:hypothetical protein